MKKMRMYVSDGSAPANYIVGFTGCVRPVPGEKADPLDKVFDPEEADEQNGEDCCGICGECGSDDDRCGFCGCRETPVVDSRFVAQLFNLPHDHVMCVIGQLLDPGIGLSEDFREANFEEVICHNDEGEEQSGCLMTRDGMFMVAMHLPGRSAAGFRELLVRHMSGGDGTSET